MSQKTYISSAYWMRNMETIQIGLMLELQRTNVHLPTLQNQLFSRRRGFQMALDPPQLLFNSSPVSLYICGVCIALVQYTHHIRLTIASHSILMPPAARHGICQKFYTDGFSGQKFYTVNFSFSDKNTKK